MASDRAIVNVYLFSGETLVAVVRDRDEEGRWVSCDPSRARHVNAHPAARRSSDVLTEALGLGGSVNPWLERWLPAATTVAETAEEARAMGRRVTGRKGTKQGRGAPWGDGRRSNRNAPDGVIAVNVKAQRADGHRAVIISTPSADTAEDQIGQLVAAHMAGARWCALVVDVTPWEDGVRIDVENLRWQILTAAPLVGHTVGSLRAQARGAGRPPAGAVLPDCWVTWKDTSCVHGSEQLSLRCSSKGMGAGWERGTLEELYERLENL